MKILFFGDSITDAGRVRDDNANLERLGYGYVKEIYDRFEKSCPDKHEIINRGISGNRIVDLLARVKCDCTNLKPDLISILIGVNDVWHEVKYSNGCRIELFEKVYRLVLEEIKLALPNVKLIMCEPFVLKGFNTENIPEIPDQYEQFKAVYDYAKVVEKLAKEYQIPLVYLQDKFTENGKKYGDEKYLFDGVHPAEGGIKLLASEWLKTFEKYFN